MSYQDSHPTLDFSRCVPLDNLSSVGESGEHYLTRARRYHDGGAPGLSLWVLAHAKPRPEQRKVFGKFSIGPEIAMSKYEKEKARRLSIRVERDRLRADRRIRKGVAA